MRTQWILRLQVLLLFLVPLVCQAIGVFLPYWAIEEPTTKGLFYQTQCFTNNTCTSEYAVLDQATLGLQSTSLIILVFVSLCATVTVCAFGPSSTGIDTESQTSGGCGACLWLHCLCFYYWVFLYPVSGVFTLAGCIRFATLYPTEVLGVGFYMCIVSCCLIILMIVVFACDEFCRKPYNERMTETLLFKIYSDCLDWNS